MSNNSGHFPISKNWVKSYALLYIKYPIYYVFLSREINAAQTKSYLAWKSEKSKSYPKLHKFSSMTF